MLRLIKAKTVDVVTSPYFVPVDDLINEAFLDVSYPYPPTMISRFGPGSLTFMVTQEEDSLSNHGIKVLATVSAEPDEALAHWKIRSLAVHPSVQERGFGSKILRCMEKEICRTYLAEMWKSKPRRSMWKRIKSKIRKSFFSRNFNDHRDDRTLHIQLETVEGFYPEWYRKRGWKVIKRFARWDDELFGWQNGYTSVVMEKNMDTTWPNLSIRPSVEAGPLLPRNRLTGTG